MRRPYETLMLAWTRWWGWLQERLFHGIGRWVPFLPEDIFISYSRADGSRYATGLAGELARHQFNCVTDVFVAEPGREIPPNLTGALRRARQLVVLATEGALHSEGVAWEVQRFPREGRSVVIVGFCELVNQAPWFLPGFDPQRESSDRLATGEPSPEIVRTIVQAHKFKTQRQRLTRFAVGVAVLMVLGAVATGWFWRAAQLASRETVSARAALKQEQDRLERVQTKVQESQQQLEKVEQQLDDTGRQVVLTEARRTALELDAIRIVQKGYTPPRDVARAVKASRDVSDIGQRPDEAEFILRGNVALLPRLGTTFRIPKGQVVVAGDPLRLFVATGGKVVRVWDVATGKEVSVPSFPSIGSAIRRMEASGGGKWLLLTTADNETGVWNPAALTPLPQARGKCPRGILVTAAAVNPRGTSLALGCGGSVVVTDLASGSPLSPPVPSSTQGSFAPRRIDLNDEVLVVRTQYDSTNFGLDRSGQFTRMRQICGTGRLLAVSSDASRVLRGPGMSESPVNEYRVCSTRIKQDDISQAPYVSGPSTAVDAPRLDGDRIGASSKLLEGELVFSGDGNYIAIPSVINVRMFESSSGKAVAVLHGRPDFSSLFVSPHGDLVVLVTIEGEVQTWAIRVFDPLLITERRNDGVVEETSSRMWLHETRAFRVTSDEESIRSLREWEFPHGPTRTTCERLAGKLSCDRKDVPWDGLALDDLASHPELGWVGLQRDGANYQVLRLEPRTELCRWTDDGDYEISRDGRIAVSTNDRQYRVRDIAQRCRMLRLARGLVVEKIKNVFSAPDGPVVAVSADPCTIRLVKLETGKPLVNGEPLADFEHCVWRGALSQDGRFLATEGTGEVGVWDLRSGKWLAKRSDVSGYVSVQSPDRRHVLVGATGGIHLWRWQLDDLIREVCDALERNLDATQFRSRLSPDELASACRSPSPPPDGPK